MSKSYENIITIFWVIEIYNINIVGEKQGIEVVQEIEVQDNKSIKWS